MSTKLYLFTIICAFLGGIVCYHNLFIDEYNNLELQKEIIEKQNKALELSDQIMWNNNVFDGDGSDTMYDYLELRNKINNLHNINN